jgi:stage II sporulation protein D
MKKLLLVLSFFYVLAAGAHTVNVRILSTMNVTSVNISVSRGHYQLFLDGKLQPDTLTAKVMQILVSGDSLEIRVPGDTIGRFANLLLRHLDDSSCFKIKPIRPVSGTRIYDHTLSLSVQNKLLFCENTVDLEHYVAGVVESESGGNSVKEFYKVQSIICRTYALAHLYRHALEGFDLCDGVHCQAYRGRPTDPKVQAAVDETQGLVLVDKGLVLITAAFHSNCGGQTASSGDVWAANLPYLRSVKDTFCLNMPNARWQRKISKDDWLNYLGSKHKFPVGDSIACQNAMSMTQSVRGSYYTYGNVRIPYKTIRSDWGLRSAYFSIEQGRDSIIIKGRGYGHGVGLCQEGAIHMAQLGYSYVDILNFYYKDVDIINLSRLEFFKEE